ncbi:MAG: LPS export ABC transporter periplasmic protein LptC [Bacteroidia bacterium]|nr:LPS export ABC transporter periplasmic protein LptC [Bacteroidia bacterium]NNJ55472.1 LPS export ABC transporter periplasmic protein LptC [Bacteroidia bacterium]
MVLDKIFGIAMIFMIIAILFGCNPSQTKEELADMNELLDSLSVEVAKDVKIVYTDSAILRAKIFAPVMKRYPDKDNPSLEMPEGVNAKFYNEYGEIQSSLSARYAINYEKRDVIEIRDSVRVINKNDEEIKTDELIWDKKNRTVVSDKPVRVRIRDEKIIMAEGFESDETFIKYTFKKVTGIVYLDEEIESTTTE